MEIDKEAQRDEGAPLMHQQDSDLVTYDLRVSDSDTEEEVPQNSHESQLNQLRKQLQLDNTLEEFGGFGKL